MRGGAELGELWERASLLCGQRSGSGELHVARAAFDASPVQRIHLVSEKELRSAFAQRGPAREFDSDRFCKLLTRALKRRRTLLKEAITLETGFVERDADELLEATFAFLNGISNRYALPTERVALHSYPFHGDTRSIRLGFAPWGLVAIVLPHNAFLPLAVTCGLSARACGNHVVLKAPLQSARSAAILADAFLDSGLESEGISIVLARGREFAASFLECERSGMLHFFGSSEPVAELASRSFQAGKHAVFECEGNVWAYVGPDAPASTADLLLSGTIRFNGQTCTSVNGVVVHPELFATVRDELGDRVSSLVTGDPKDPATQVGPLFDEQLAERNLQILSNSGGRLLCGGGGSGSLLFPALIESPDPRSELVSEGVFGCALWIASGTEEDFVRLWPSNRFPLCAAVYEGPDSRDAWLSRLPNLARLCVNGDPSHEDPFEPWGGYPCSGNSPVAVWIDKYRRTCQVDAPTRARRRLARNVRGADRKAA